MKWTSRKKLKAKIAELKSERDSLSIDCYHLCEDYNSEKSLQIRMSHSMARAIGKELFAGDITGPEVKGILTKAQE